MEGGERLTVATSPSEPIAAAERPLDRRAVALVGVALAAPAIAGALLPWSDGDTTHLWACPFRELTGSPCPGCGATRAFVALMHGDLGFTSFNWAWVALWAALAIALALVVLGVKRPRAAILGYLRAPPAKATIAVTLGFVAVAWAVALANSGAILD